MDLKDIERQIDNEPANITYFFRRYKSDEMFATEEAEASQIYKRYNMFNLYVGRTDGKDYKQRSIELRNKIRIAKQEADKIEDLGKRQMRMDEIKTNAQKAVKRIFEMEVEKAKLDKTPPSSKSGCVGGNIDAQGQAWINSFLKL